MTNPLEGLDPAVKEQLAEFILKKSQELKKQDSLETIISKQKLFYDDYNNYVEVKTNNSRELMISPSEELKTWLTYEYHKSKGSYPQEKHLVNYLKTLKYEIRAKGTKIKLYNRFAFVGRKLYIDLGTENRSVAEIDSSGLKICDTSPIFFSRYKKLHEIVIGTKEVDPHIIFDYINISNRDDRLLTLIWLITSCLPHIERPILLLTGEAEGGKTTMARFFRSIFDPCESLDTSSTTKEDDLALIFHKNAIPLIDNAGSFSKQISDFYCRAVTETTFQKKILYTDAELLTLNFKRSPIITSIGIPSSENDFLSRCLIIGSSAIASDKKKKLNDIKAQFERLKPNLDYTFIKILERAMTIIDSFKLNHSTRMADFDMWGVAISKTLNYENKTQFQSQH